MKNKGITLISLVVIITVILILAGTAVYFGSDTIKKSKEQRFVTQLKQINEAVKLHSQDYEQLDLTELNEEYIVTINGNNHTYNYKLENESDYNKIGLQDIDIEDNIYINFIETEIYAENGFEGKHTLEDFGITYYKPSKVQSSVVDVDFNIVLEPQENSWKYIIPYEDITCNGNIQNGNLLYSEYIDGTEHAWKRVQKGQDGFELIITKPGIYELMFKDETGVESQIKQVYAYVKNGLKLYYDGTYNSKDEDGSISHNSSASTWADLSENENDLILQGINFNGDSGWTQNNSLKFDGINDCGVTDEVVNYNNSKEVSIQMVDLNHLINNTATNIIIESSNNYNGYVGAFYIDNREYLNNSDLTFGFKGNNLTYNLRNADLIIKNKNQLYTFICNTNNNDSFIKIYSGKDENNIVQSSADTNSDISNITFANYKLYIAARNCSQYYSKVNIGTFRIYNRALSEEEIEQNYNIDKIRYNIQEE